jgi:HlyD family secretion protein
VTTREKNDSTAHNQTAQNLNNNQAEVDGRSTLDNGLDEVVFVVQPDGTVRKQIVQSGIQDINNIEITSGLKEGEEVVTGPYDVVSKTLKPKDRVKVVSKADLFSGKK